MEITLDRNSRLARAFFWSQELNNAFRDREYRLVNRESTNFCYLVRALFLHIPFVLFMQAYTIFMVGMAVVGLPIYLFGAAGWWKPLVAFAALLVAVVCVICLVNLSEAISDWRNERRHERFISSHKPSLIVQYVLAQKQKICPYISFSEKS